MRGYSLDEVRVEAGNQVVDLADLLLEVVPYIVLPRQVLHGFDERVKVLLKPLPARELLDELPDGLVINSGGLDVNHLPVLLPPDELVQSGIAGGERDSTSSCYLILAKGIALVDTLSSS